MKRLRPRRGDLRDQFFRAALVLALLLVGEAPLFADAPICSSSYITDETQGDETINQYGGNYQSVNVFAFQYDGQCRIVGRSPWVEGEARHIKDDPHRLVLVTFVNEIKAGPGPCQQLTPGQAVLHLLSDPALRARHVREVVALGALGQGVEIDFENLPLEVKPYYTQFLADLRAALPPEKRLAVVVQPKTGGATEQGASIDWRAIEPYVDYIRVMAYYYSWKTSPPGPVVKYAKLAQLADYIMKNPTQSIPAAKARIILSLYGWDWPVSPVGPGQLIRYEQAMALAQAKGVVPLRDPKEDTLYFRYQDDAGVTHEVWVDDVEGSRKRVQLLMDRGFQNVDLWHLNTGDTRLWQWFTPFVRSNCPSLAGQPSPPPAAAPASFGVSAVKVGSSDTPVSLSGENFTPSDVLLWGGNPLIPSQADAGTIQAVVPAAEFATPRVIQVSVAQGGRLSGAVNFYVVGNPVIDSFSPSAAAAGRSFTLSVRGLGFEPGSTLTWNGNTIPTRFVSDTQLSANILADDAPRAGSIRVGVYNPTSDSRISRFFPLLPPGAVGKEGDAVVAGPNPWSAEKDAAGGIRFFGVPPGDEVSIYTVSGVFVKKVSVADVEGAEWDLTNEGGESVASGLYVYAVTGPGGGPRRGTLAVVR